MDRREREHILQRLQADAARIAAHFDLEYKSIQAEHPRVRARYGVCYDDGLIKIRLNHVRTKEPLRYSSLIDTLCHELAHLKHFNHGPQFKAFFWRILGWARKQGIYRPKKRGTARLESGQRPAPSRPPGRRNGVAVFAEAPQTSELLPWQRRSQLVMGIAKRDVTDEKSQANRSPLSNDATCARDGVAEVRLIVSTSQ